MHSEKKKKSIQCRSFLFVFSYCMKKKKLIFFRLLIMLEFTRFHWTRAYVHREETKTQVAACCCTPLNTRLCFINFQCQIQIDMVFVVCCGENCIYIE